MPLLYSVQVLGSAVERSSRAFVSLKTIPSLTAIGRWVKNGWYAYRWRSFALRRRNDLVAPITVVRGGTFELRASTPTPVRGRRRYRAAAIGSRRRARLLRTPIAPLTSAHRVGPSPLSDPRCRTPR